MDTGALVVLDLLLIISFSIALFASVASVVHLISKFVLIIADIMNNKATNCSFSLEIVFISVSWILFYIVTLKKSSYLILAAGL